MSSLARYGFASAWVSVERLMHVLAKTKTKQRMGHDCSTQLIGWESLEGLCRSVNAHKGWS